MKLGSLQTDSGPWMCYKSPFTHFIRHTTFYISMQILFFNHTLWLEHPMALIKWKLINSTSFLFMHIIQQRWKTNFSYLVQQWSSQSNENGNLYKLSIPNFSNRAGLKVYCMHFVVGIESIPYKLHFTFIVKESHANIIWQFKLPNRRTWIGKWHLHDFR